MRTVLINDCTAVNPWYAEMIGQTIDIKKTELPDEYIPVCPIHNVGGKMVVGRGILKRDCELVEEGENNAL